MPLARLIDHAADAVAAVRAGASLNDALARCPELARPGTQALSFHALRWLGTAEAVRRRLAPKAPAPALDALLLTALALLWPEDAPPYAAHTLVDQAVAAARRRAPRSAGFVNAVLRRCLRERAALAEALAPDPVARTNHPAWWVERLARDWPAQAEAILAADNARPPMTLRVHARRGNAARYVERLAAAGMAARPVGPQAVQLAEPCPVAQLPGFADGDVSVQDAAAQLAAPLLIGAGLPPGARVLDACAAPGGKTAHLLELAELDVLALDRDPARLARVGQTLARLHLQARCVAADAGEPAAWWDGRPFDAVLLDAPCSASGIVRRHPDVRWLRRPADIAALAATQARLLDALWPLLAPGGRLLYCTCSVFRAEGQDQIDAFLQRRPGATLAPSPPSPGHLLPLPDNAGEAGRGDGAAGPDGFFYALIQKSS
ncbi:MAG: 16S rRNA (cytosine(967)-C(5))-methyltransferase RsmB [Proteobacteria bacterium]|nr:16S rRNA (cytosine(967)-C(5))-methyltransferase RsmB [Pseudomonadota bacterium]